MAAGNSREATISHIVAVAAEALTLEEMGQGVLPLFERLIGSGRMMLYTSRETEPLVSIAGAGDCLPEYVSEFAAEDPIQDFLRRENPHLFSVSRWSEWRAFRSNNAYREFYDRWDLSWLFHMRLNESDHMRPGYTAIVCGRSAKQADFSEADFRAAAAVLPALKAAVRRSGRFAAKLSSAAAMEALFERGQARALLALDLRGNLMWMSAQAEKLLSPYLGGRKVLPESLGSTARRLGAVARGDAREMAAYKVSIPGEKGAPLEAEVYLARTAQGEPFVAADFGGAGVPPNLIEVAQHRGLTRAELEVLSDLVSGQSDAEIASRRFVSIPTVRTHVTRVIHKFGVRSRLQAVAFALGTTPKNSTN